MVVVDARQHRAGQAQVRQQVDGDLGVAPHQLPFAIVEWAGFVQDRVVDHDLAQVVQPPCPSGHQHLLRRQFHALRQACGHCADALGVGGGVRIAGIDGCGKRLQRPTGLTLEGAVAFDRQEHGRQDQHREGQHLRGAADDHRQYDRKAGLHQVGEQLGGTDPTLGIPAITGDRRRDGLDRDDHDRHVCQQHHDDGRIHGPSKDPLVAVREGTLVGRSAREGRRERHAGVEQHPDRGAPANRLTERGGSTGDDRGPPWGKQDHCRQVEAGGEAERVLGLVLVAGDRQQLHRCARQQQTEPEPQPWRVAALGEERRGDHRGSGDRQRDRKDDPRGAVHRLSPRSTINTGCGPMPLLRVC